MSKSRKVYILYGIFGITILFVAYWGFNFLKGTSIFNKTYSYQIYYDRIEGLNTSSVVTVNGFKVGQVTDIKLLPKENQRLKVTIQISNEFLLPDSTIAKIYSMDLLGSKGIDLIFGSSSTKYHKDGDVLIGKVEQSLRDQVSIQMLPIKNQVESLMKELSNAIEIISHVFNESTRDNLEKSFSSIKNTLSHIEHAAYEFDTLLINETSKVSKIISNIEYITKALRNNKEQFDNIINNISDFSDMLHAIDISKTILQVNNIVAKIDDIVGKVQTGEGTLGKLLNDDALFDELENSVESLDNLINDIRSNPRKYINLSLIKIGRTVNVSNESELSTRDKKALEKQKKKDEKQNNSKNEGNQDTSENTNLYFMIQIKSTKKPIAINSTEFKGYEGVVEKLTDGRYKYFLFEHIDPTQTKYYLEIVREDFPDAFPVAFYLNRQITYTEAKEYLSNN